MMGRIGSYCPVEDYAIIGDGSTAALVSLDGSIDWACFPRFDAPSVFARLLDAEKGGYWQIVPTGAWASEHRYLPDTNVLSTSFQTATGNVEVLDFMPVQRLGGVAPDDNCVVRIVRGRQGRVEMAHRFAPRFDYARARAEWTVQHGRGVRAVYRTQTLTLYSDGPLEAVDGEARGLLTLNEGEEVVLLLTYRSGDSVLWRSDATQTGLRLLGETGDYWREWVDRCGYQGAYQEAVRRSALVLKLLDYEATGALIAAPTTSLPEEIGGERNWDYRYSWLRDTAFTLYALYGLGYREEGEAFLEWIADVASCEPSALQVLYGVGGERTIEEAELTHLEGYRGSRPVRIGNGAYSQRQLDIYGEVLDCAYLHQKHGGVISPQLWAFLRAIVDYVCAVWRRRDQGIWEVRNSARHFVYSKALCWVALDRGIRLARQCDLPADRDLWEDNRSVLFEELLRDGYDEEIGAFTQAYGTEELDASALALLLRGVLPPDDSRMRSTVDRVAERLCEDGFVHRYLPSVDDGMTGGEGAFLMCSFWLADCYAEMGRIEQARTLLAYLLSHANDVGLYAEELDPVTRLHLGNFPQAFTHIALINAVLSLAKAESAQGNSV